MLNENYELVLHISVPIAPRLRQQNGEGLPRFPGHWGNAIISIRYRNFIWIEDVIQMVEEVIGQNRIVDEEPVSSGKSSLGHLSDKSILSVEKITKALGKKFSDNYDIETIRFLSEFRKKIEEEADHKIEIKVLLADAHAKMNGIDDFETYLDGV